tara:strand:- start:2326 stop:2631 length:306 start_codon:yes stop_codon:yes gene_type:complete
MTNKITRGSDGLYHIKGKTYRFLEGSRVQVMNNNAYKTSGGLTRDKLMKNKRGYIVSKAKHNTAKKEKRLEKAGYFTKKGHFGYVKKSVKKASRKTRKQRR